MNASVMTRLERQTLGLCKNLQSHLVQCLNDSDDSYHYEEMMFAFKNLSPELSGWILQTTLEQWNEETHDDDYELNIEF